MSTTPLPAGVDLHSVHRLAPERYPFLLQSTATSSTLGGFDVLFVTNGDALILEQPGRLSGHGANDQSEFLPALDAWWQQEQVDSTGDDWPFTGGWFLYLGYELASEVEPRLELRPDPIMPTAFAVRCPAAIIRSHQDGNCFFIAESSGGIDCAVVLEDVAASEALSESQSLDASLIIEEEDPSLFLEAVATAKQYIARGEIYQANLSRGWSATMDQDVDANKIYKALRTANPGPFAGLIKWRGVSVVSSSPERLLQVKNGIASTRPTAGTRPRSTDKAKDQQLLEELLAHPKGRAEHVMLIDLERNDLGRVCDPGTVEVNEKMVVESYAHVHHIVSNVRGQLRAGITPGEVIRAVFPGGTITGCPKVRCMEIISELETGPRGAYTGSFGYLNRDGSLDLNILIRTLVIRDNQVTLRAGSGIVADSEPEAELSETRAKAKGLIRALSR